MKNKKSQLYGLSGFIYVLAIAIILIIGTVGISKEFELKSASGLTRFNAVMASRNAEILKKIMDQERGYVVDQALFVTGSFGGYSSYKDMLPTVDCTEVSGCYWPDGTAMTADAACDTSYGAAANDWKCDLTSGYCYEVADVNNKLTLNVSKVQCYPQIDNGAGTICGIKKAGFDYLGEKKVPYWRTSATTTCVPSEEKVTDVFKDFANYFGAMDPAITAALTLQTGRAINFEYVMKLISKSGDEIHTQWFSTSGPITIDTPPAPDEPIVSYTFTPFVDIRSRTSFFKIFNESKDFVLNKEFESYLTHPANSPIPTIIDEDFVIARHNQTQYEEFDCDDSTEFCMPGQTSTTDSPDPRPFKLLVNYTIGARDPNTGALLYPDSPISCSASGAPFILTDINQVSNESTTTGSKFRCTIHTVRDPATGLLILDTTLGDGADGTSNDGFSGKCAKDRDVDERALKCVMIRTINKMSQDLKLADVDVAREDPDANSHHESNLSWRYDIYRFNLTFTGEWNEGYRAYNASNCRNCTNMTCDGYTYCSGTLDIAGHVDTNASDKTCTSETSGTAKMLVEARAKLSDQSDSTCRSVVPFAVSITDNANNILASITKEILISGGNTWTDWTKVWTGKQTVTSTTATKTKITYSVPAYTGGSAQTRTATMAYCEEENVDYFAATGTETNVPCGSYISRGSWTCTTNDDCAIVGASNCDDYSGYSDYLKYSPDAYASMACTTRGICVLDCALAGQFYCPGYATRCVTGCDDSAAGTPAVTLSSAIVYSQQNVVATISGLCGAACNTTKVLISADNGAGQLKDCGTYPTTGDMTCTFSAPYTDVFPYLDYVLTFTVEGTGKTVTTPLRVRACGVEKADGTNLPNCPSEVPNTKSGCYKAHKTNGTHCFKCGQIGEPCCDDLGFDILYVPSEFYVDTRCFGDTTQPTECYSETCQKCGGDGQQACYIDDPPMACKGSLATTTGDTDANHYYIDATNTCHQCSGCSWGCKSTHDGCAGAYCSGSYDTCCKRGYNNNCVNSCNDQGSHTCCCPDASNLWYVSGCVAPNGYPLRYYSCGCWNCDCGGSCDCCIGPAGSGCESSNVVCSPKDWCNSNTGWWVYSNFCNH